MIIFVSEIFKSFSPAIYCFIYFINWTVDVYWKNYLVEIFHWPNYKYEKCNVRNLGEHLRCQLKSIRLLFATELLNCGKYWFLFCQGAEMKAFLPVLYIILPFWTEGTQWNKRRKECQVVKKAQRNQPSFVLVQTGVYYISDTRTLYLLTCSVMPILYCHVCLFVCFFMRKADSQCKV